MSTGGRLATIFGSALVIIVVAVMVIFVVPPNTSPHFGFPSQQQARSSLIQNVTKSATIKKSEYVANKSGAIYYFDEVQVTYYSASNLLVGVAEVTFNSTSIATSFYKLETSSVAQSVYNTSFAYDSVTVILFYQAIGPGQHTIGIFHDGRFVCVVYMFNSTGLEINLTPFVKGVVSSVV